MFQKIKTVINLVVIIALISTFATFFANNSIYVELNLAPFNYILEVKLFILVIFFFILGFVFSFITDFFNNLFLFFANIKDNKIKKLKEKIKLLKDKK